MEDLDLFSHFGTDVTSSDPNLPPREEEGNTNNNNNNEDEVTVTVGEKRKMMQMDNSPSEGGQSHQIEQKKRKLLDCSHEIALPKSLTNVPEFRMGVEPTLEYAPQKYPFTLDTFQQESVSCVEQERSVLVSAHTSAGKTLVAEYAISMSLKQQSRVIYTSPIKALSNQKYRDLSELFGEEVGLITGDVTISPNANCLVMTTEILRTMLYKGHKLLTSVRWVVFDEIHYLCDPERGVVWEECIILLPNEVKYVFLSATVPNAFEFASWVAELKLQPVHVVYTDKRPIPLQHYAYPHGGKGIYLIKDEKSKFREDNFKKMISDNREPTGNKQIRRKFSEAQSIAVNKLLQLLKERNLLPCIFFAFSRKNCENLAMNLKRIDLTDNDQNTKKMIREIFDAALDSLNDEDRKLPQIQNILPLLLRGIAIHHSGLLPLIKEIIEILFQMGLIKCLFATETFAMGLNMPARTCIFVSLKKFDGISLRYLKSGEYIQMSGRAGRRGKDKRGKVITIVEQSGMEVEELKNLVLGQPTILESSFKLSVYTVLNMIRVESVDPTYLIDRSFRKFQAQKKIPEMQQKRADFVSQYSEINIDCENFIEKIYTLKSEQNFLRNEINSEIIKPQYAVPFLQPGRLIVLKNNWGYGIFVSHHKITNSASVEELAENNYIIDVLVLVQTPNSIPTQVYHSFEEQKNDLEIIECNQMHVISFKLNMVDNISKIRLYLSPKLNHQKDLDGMKKRLVGTLEQLKDGAIPFLDPVNDFKIDGIESLVQKSYDCEKRLALVEKEIKESSSLKDPSDFKISVEFEKYKKRLRLKREISELDEKIKFLGKEKSSFQFQKLKEFFIDLEYLTNTEVLSKKGKIAAEISTTDGVIITELLLTSNFINETPVMMGSILSVFVASSGTDKEYNPKQMPKEIIERYEFVRKVIMSVLKKKRKFELIDDEQKVIEEYSPCLMEVTYKWLSGDKFKNIAAITNVYEGEIVRVMRRLEELLRQIVFAAKVIGERDLEKKLNIVSEKLKRDIIFTGSLYT